MRADNAAEKEAAARRAAEWQVLEDAEHLVGAWNDRQAKRMPTLFSPTISAAIRRAALVPVGALSGLSHNERDRSAPRRSSPRCGVTSLIQARCFVDRAVHTRRLPSW